MIDLECLVGLCGYPASLLSNCPLEALMRSRSILILPCEQVQEGLLQLVQFNHESQVYSALVLRRRGLPVAFLNRCPHWRIPLGSSAEGIASGDQPLVRCGTHGALFRLDDGICIFGPCVGEALEAMPLCDAMGHLFVFLPRSLRGASGRRGKNSLQVGNVSGNSGV